MELGSLLGRVKNEALRGCGGRCLGKWEEREGNLAFADRSTCFIFIIALFTTGYLLILFVLLFVIYPLLLEYRYHESKELAYFVHCCISWTRNSTWHIVEASCVHLLNE